jgi:hypothetical protein
MNRIKREGVIALMVLLLIGLTSCEKDALSGAGGKVAVNFTLAHLPYGEEGADMRSAGRRRMNPSTVMATVEGSLKMYATLEEDEAPLRGLETMAVGTRLRIVAYDSNNDYAGDAEYEVANASGAIKAVDAALSVDGGDNYRFVAYSLNTSAALPYAATMGPYSAGSVDVLWGESGIENIVESGSYNIIIPMKHQFSRVTVEVTSASFGSPAIEAIEAAVDGYQANLTAKVGLTKGDAEDQMFTSFSSLGSTTVTSNQRVVYAGGESTTGVKVTSVTLGETVRSFPVPARFNRQLEPGKSYTLRISFKTLRWARSNIYWNGQTLTFVPAGSDKSKEGYQGVFFKWGSLVGISPARFAAGSTNAAKNAFYGASTPLFVPYGYPDDPKWKQTTGNAMMNDGDFPNVTSMWNTWGNNTVNATDIPYMDPSYTASDYGRDNTYVLDAERNTTAMYQGFRGDICQYLSSKTGVVSGNYRLPNSYEFGTINIVWTQHTDGWVRMSFDSGSDDNAGLFDGTRDFLTYSDWINSGGGRRITHPQMDDVVLPASGCRAPSNQTYPLNSIGSGGFYWIGAAYSDEVGYFLYYDGTNLAPWWFLNRNRSYGHAVRCVTN